MSVAVSGSNPDYTLKSVLTAELNPVPAHEENTSRTPAPVSTNGGVHTAPPVNLSAHGVGGSVNHQG